MMSEERRETPLEFTLNDHPETYDEQGDRAEKGVTFASDHDDVDEIEEDVAVEVVNLDRTLHNPIVATFKDHFTLKLPSSTIRYRDQTTAARAIESTDAQFVLEEAYDPDTGKKEITIRSIQDTSEGVYFLRIVYVIVTAFWTGFLFVFCLQILLFLFLDLALQVGATSQQEARWGSALGVIFSIIPLVHGLASALVIAGAYIADTWKGHPLIRNFTFRNLSVVSVEWIFFTAFLGAPIFVLCCTLLTRRENWWTITSLVWFSSVLIFYCAFCANVLFYEISACWEVSRNRFDDDNDGFFHVLYRSILLRQTATYGGRKTVRFLAAGSIPDAEYTDKGSQRNMMVEESRTETISLRAKVTRWPLLETLGLYKELEEPERTYSIDDARDIRPYVTSYTWGLEKIFCRPKNSRYIAIIHGPGAITRSQMRSSLLCSLIGTFLIFFVILSGLVYMQLGGAGTVFILVVGVWLAYPTIRGMFALYKTARTTIEARELARTKKKALNRNIVSDSHCKEVSEAIYLVVETYRITKPTAFSCWFMFCAEILFLFVWPLASLFRVGNWPLGFTFGIIVFISGIRYYLNAAVVLEETGNMRLVHGKNEDDEWASQARLNEIVGNITRGRSKKVWMSVLGSLSLVFLALFVGAIGTTQADNAQADASVSTQNVTDHIYLSTSDFVYRQLDSLRYPTCQLADGSRGGPLNLLVDYAFLAGLAYRDTSVTQSELNVWFGDGVAVDNSNVVDDFRLERQIFSRVSFKLITFPNSNNFAYVLIRGTTNNWDMLTDAQLWAAAALMQVHRLILPIGEIWTPIMDQLIHMITTIESESIAKVSFYKDTVSFVEYLQKNSSYGGVSVTGHSLGGGLSMITGAITKVPAVALSGPNAVLTRKSFDPPVTREDLDRYTFNIIPERDVVPMIDDRAQNYQVIRCLAPYADFIACHTSTRSLCEIMYTCGSRGRPVPCYCHSEFGYQPPVSLSNVSYVQACELEP